MFVSGRSSVKLLPLSGIPGGIERKKTAHLFFRGVMKTIQLELLKCGRMASHGLSETANKSSVTCFVGKKQFSTINCILKAVFNL